MLHGSHRTRARCRSTAASPDTGDSAHHPGVSDVTETANQASFLTQGAYDRLTAELEELSGPGRSEIAKKIEAARAEGDLKENGGYHAAKEEQGKMEARIRQLTQLLENAVIGEKPADDGVVEPGMVVTVEMFGDEETFLLGSREISDSSMHVFSEKSPIGAAVNGAKVGDIVSYEAPNGNQVEVKVVHTTPYEG
jgi:transcription elongation factor GreA